MSAGQRRRLSNPKSQAQYLYEARGDSVQALQVYNAIASSNGNGSDNDHDDLSRRHNLALLTFLTDDARNSSEQAFLIALKEMHSMSKRNDRSGDGDGDDGSNSEDRGLLMQQLVLAHNIALNHLVANNPGDAKEMLLPLFQSFSSGDGDFDDRLGSIQCKIAFLLIDCILALFSVDGVTDIFRWIEKYVANIKSADEDGRTNLYAAESPTELKFRLHCYKSRFFFTDSKHQDQSKIESNSRLARKELKNAMEIYNHKLSGKKYKDPTEETKQSGAGSGSRVDTYDGTASVQDSLGETSNDHQNLVTVSYHNTTGNGQDAATNSGGVNAGGGAYDPRSPYEIKKADAQNQHALYLKANLEYLKGNDKKSLKLCSEAIHSSIRHKEANGTLHREDDAYQDMSDAQSAIYNNNIALVHQTSGQIFHALHYYSIALGHMEQIQEGMDVDNDGTLSQVSFSQLLFNSAICAQKVGNYLSAYECMSRAMESFPKDYSQDPFNWLHLGESCIGIYSSKKNDAEMKLNQCFNPLQKALQCFMTVISLCSVKNQKHKNYLESARVSLAYLWMELNNPAPVIRIADIVLAAPLESSKDSSRGGDLILSLRRRAIMRIYACEAMCLLGNPEGGLSYLKGGKSDIELASEVDHMVEAILAGQHQNNPSMSFSLRASIHLSIAGASALIGDCDVSKEIAQNLIQSQVSSENTASAKNTLLYCLLSEGKTV